ncbi:CRISPR-associated protein Csx11 [Desulfurobacterium sp.]|uniref:CRISPR-associated protein Csx11 n=1 Tax=Desulfurobacterium sp. TaxID=2004706 RepID=UPI00263529EF|nr:CRISPR-associated protein Csx11 [Desulfurobacterium sp.]
MVKLPDNTNNTNLNWLEFFKGDASGENIIQKIFFRGCENVNSGIDKGSPQDANQLENLWISNAFGSLKKEINDENDFDSSRLCFFRDFHRFLEDKYYYRSPDWKEIRNWVFEHVKPWYSRLLSDSRFPVNDVTLFDQAYMTASMFKAVLASLYLDNSNYQNFIKNPQLIKWSVLGIQYDKLALAEKGLKVASIKWYRETVNKVDNQLKKLIEIEYPLGNEVYRDETGIYFVVGENIKGDKDSEFYKLNDALSAIKTKIQDIFTSNFEGEIYPAILLTEPSRGLMNLGHLVEKAKENFLKAEYPSDFKTKLKHDSNPNSICQICNMRLAHKGNKENLICNVCFKRQQGRVNDWLTNAEKETIWIEEIKDKNDRVAYVSLKFELDEWFNGNMLNSLVVKDENFKDRINTTKTILNGLKRIIDINTLKDSWNVISNKVNVFLDLFDKNGIKKPYENVLKEKYLKKINTQPIKNLNKREIELKNLFLRSLEICLDLVGTDQNNWISYIQNTFQTNCNFDFNEKRFKNQKFLQNNDVLNFLKASFGIGFTVLQIHNLLLERSIGSRWKKFIKNNLSDETAIDFKNRKIYWQKLNNQDIEFLAYLILQFLLRKNPSPARLRRIWETTKEFFEEMRQELEEILKIPEWRKKRLVWEVTLDENNRLDKSTELEGDGLLFWAEKEGSKAKIYLISSIESFLEKYGKEKIREILNSKDNTEIIDSLKGGYGLKNKKLLLKEYKTKEHKIELDIKENLKEIISYKPFALITNPSPVNYQVIIPAEYLPELIDRTIEKYNKEFKYVYGKLPIHIGIVISDYKKPVYVNLKALRKIRRNVKDTDKLYRPVNAGRFYTLQKQKFTYATPEEKAAEAYYSLYWDNPEGKGYNFYINPENGRKKWISTICEFNADEKVQIIPNTFDYEYLDHNIRRSEITYDESGKRMLALKSNRPYEIEVYWEKFKAFRTLSKDTNLQTSRLHKLIGILYSKVQYEEFADWGAFLASSFINWLELGKNEDRRKLIKEIFELDADCKTLSEDFKRELKEKLEIKENILLFLDMFNFWHTALKEVKDE